METNLKPMRCGGCGADTFKAYTADETRAILLECTDCESVSRIEPAPATLQVEWAQRRDGGDSDGRISMWD